MNILAQGAGDNFDFWQQLANLGIGALVAGPVFFLFLRENKAKTEAEARERDLYTSMMPFLKDGIETLKEIKDSFETKELTAKEEREKKLEEALSKLDIILGKANG